MKRPAFQFYPADWRKDAALQSCSIEARGVWHELMCVMHECVPYGHLVIKGKAPDDAQAARLIGVELGKYRRCMAQLWAAGVPSKTDEGVIYSRRMVRDERHRVTRAAGGQLGADYGIKGAEYGKFGGRPKGGKEPPLQDDKEPPLYPPPSSSSSASSKNELREPPVDNSASGQSWAQHWMAQGKAMGINPRKGESEKAYCDRVIARAK